MKINSGIYCIENLINGKLYIGSSCNLKQRKHSHFSNLKNNRHNNNHLLNSYKIYGEDNFIFRVLEYENNLSMLLEREQYWYDYYIKNNIELYNTKRPFKYCFNRTEIDLSIKLSLSKSGKKHKNRIANCIKTKYKNNFSMALIEKFRKQYGTKIVQYDRFTNEIINVWDSIKFASDSLDIARASITRALKKKQISAGGFLWNYLEN